jgi:hypothetical protein
VRDEHPAGDHLLVLGRVHAVHALGGGTGLDTLSLRGERRTPSGPTALTEIAPRALRSRRRRLS